MVSSLFFGSLWRCGWRPSQAARHFETKPDSRLRWTLQYLSLLSRVLSATWGSRRGHGTRRFALVGLAGWFEDVSNLLHIWHVNHLKIFEGFWRIWLCLINNRGTACCICCAQPKSSQGIAMCHDRLVHTHDISWRWWWWWWWWWWRRWWSF